MKTPSPISKKTLNKLLSDIIGIVKRKDCGTVINLIRREQYYRINQLIEDKDLKNALIIDCSNPKLEDPEDLNKMLTKNISAILLINADFLLTEKKSLLNYINTLPHKNNNLSVIYFFQTNITYKKYLSKLSHFHTLYQNLIFYPFYYPVDVATFISYLKIKFRVKLPGKIKTMITQRCGGYLWLIKEALRYYAMTKDYTHLFDHETMELKLKIIFDEFQNDEKAVLEKIAKNLKDFTSEEKEIIDYFKKINLSIPLLESYIRKQLNQKTIINLNNQNQLVINGVNIDTVFTRREKKIIRYFIGHKDQIIKRERVAEIIWGKDYQEFYTDWALDQIIRRVRNKLAELGLSRTLIKTKKNLGFICEI